MEIEWIGAIAFLVLIIFWIAHSHKKHYSSDSSPVFRTTRERAREEVTERNSEGEINHLFAEIEAEVRKAKEIETQLTQALGSHNSENLGQSHQSLEDVNIEDITNKITAIKTKIDENVGKIESKLSSVDGSFKREAEAKITRIKQEEMALINNLHS
jgi:hypothetical protein